MASTSEALSKKIDRVKKSIERFPAAASSLNSATAQLGQSIGQLDAVLKKFSLGIPTWVSFNGSDDTIPSYYHEDLGYAKIGGRWGIAVRTVSGDVRAEEDDSVEQWLLPDAPRFLAVQAIEKVPELLEAILKGAAEMTNRMTEKAAEVDALAVGINSVINPPAKARVAQRDSDRINAVAEAIQNANYAVGAIPAGLDLAAAIHDLSRVSEFTTVVADLDTSGIANASSMASAAIAQAIAQPAGDIVVPKSLAGAKVRK
jgi:hypothetical protein